MVKFTQEMKEAFRVTGKGGSLVYLCTSSRDGNPNIAAMRFVATCMDDKILIADIFLLKTKAHFKENPEVAVYRTGEGDLDRLCGIEHLLEPLGAVLCDDRPKIDVQTV